MNTIISPMTRLAGCVIVALLLTTQLHAQVEQQWQSGVLNHPLGFYYSTCAAIDSNDAVLVGGIANYYSAAAPFVSKFDAQGRECWRYIVGDWRTSNMAVDKLVVDQQGNVLLTWRPRAGVAGPAVLVTLSANGEFLWEYAEPFVQAGDFYTCSEGVQANSDGTIYFLAATPDDRLILSKLSPTGQIIWRHDLGVTTIPNYSISDTLTLDREGGVVIVGGYRTLLPSFPRQEAVYGFTTKINGLGQFEWWNNDYKGNEVPILYSSVSVGPKGRICSSGLLRYVTTLSEKGKSLHTQVSAGGKILLANEAGFLLQQGATLGLVGSNGSLRWSSSFGLSDVAGVLPGMTGGFLVVGSGPDTYDSLEFLQVTDKGSITSRSTVAGFPYAPGWWPRQLNNCFRASDGTIRVVLNLPFSEPGGIAVAAFSPGGAVQ